MAHAFYQNQEAGLVNGMLDRIARNFRPASFGTGAVEVERKKLGEFELIASVFAPLTRGDPRALGLLDDAAILSEKIGFETVITANSMVSGVHFLDTEKPDVVARRLLRVNLSDLAAMGAEPTGYFLNLTLPSIIDKNWLMSFAYGLGKDQTRFNISLLGGDTTHSESELTLTTFIGEVPAGQAVTRSGASPGDRVYVSGTVGDAMLGLRELKSGIAVPQILKAVFNCLITVLSGLPLGE